jgi:phosphohistidine phosphatase SixA
MMQVSWSRVRQLQQYATTLLFLLSTPGLLFAAQLVGDTTPKLSGQALIHELKKGGYVIYFRHGATSNSGEKDVVDKDLDNCAIQRNLSDEGRNQTKEIGAAFRKLRIPVGEVYASPYCRCLDTAKNIFGKGQKSRALHFAIHLESAERTAVTLQLLDLLGTVPQPGTNTTLVSHTANLQEAVGIWPKPEGVAHVFKPEGEGQFSYIGVMLPEAWAQAASLAVATAEEPGEQGWLNTVKRWFHTLF